MISLAARGEGSRGGAGAYAGVDPRSGNQNASPSRPDAHGALGVAGFRETLELVEAIDDACAVCFMVVSATGHHSCAGVGHVDPVQDLDIRLA